MEKKTCKTYYCAKCDDYPDEIIRIFMRARQEWVWNETRQKYIKLCTDLYALNKVVCKKCGFKLQER